MFCQHYLYGRPAEPLHDYRFLILSLHRFIQYQHSDIYQQSHVGKHKHAYTGVDKHTAYGSFRKLGVPYFGVLIIRILLFKVLLGSPIFGNSHINMQIASLTCVGWSLAGGL